MGESGTQDYYYENQISVCAVKYPENNHQYFLAFPTYPPVFLAFWYALNNIPKSPMK